MLWLRSHPLGMWHLLIVGVCARVLNVLTPPLFTSFASTLNRLISIQPMQMRPGERRLCNICSSSFAAGASELGTGAGPAPHIRMVIHQSVRWHARRKKGEPHSADRDISFTKHFLLCTWKHGIITRWGDAPWNGMGAQIRGSGHSAVSTEMRVILYTEMPVSVEKAPQVQVRHSHRQLHDIAARQTFSFDLEAVEWYSPAQEINSTWGSLQDTAQTIQNDWHTSGDTRRPTVQSSTAR